MSVGGGKEGVWSPYSIWLLAKGSPRQDSQHEGIQRWGFNVPTVIGHLCPFAHVMPPTEPTLLPLLSPHSNTPPESQFQAPLLQEVFSNPLAELPIPVLSSGLPEGYVCLDPSSLLEGGMQLSWGGDGGVGVRVAMEGLALTCSSWQPGLGVWISWYSDTPCHWRCLPWTSPASEWAGTGAM